MIRLEDMAPALVELRLRMCALEGPDEKAQSDCARPRDERSVEVCGPSRVSQPARRNRSNARVLP